MPIIKKLPLKISYHAAIVGLVVVGMFGPMIILVKNLCDGYPELPGLVVTLDLIISAVGLTSCLVLLVGAIVVRMRNIHLIGIQSPTYHACDSALQISFGCPAGLPCDLQVLDAWNGIAPRHFYGNGSQELWKAPCDAHIEYRCYW